MAAVADDLARLQAVKNVDSEFKPPSTGLSWAIASLALDILEVVVLAEIIFFDKPRAEIGQGLGALEIYFIITVAGTIGQAIGVYLVTRGFYHIGGIFQIVSSSTQVIKLDGIIGVIGGIKAYRFPRQSRLALKRFLDDEQGGNKRGPAPT